MLVEVLYFEGCPGQERLLPVVRRLASRVGAEVALRRVETLEDADAQRFLGSPTIRVDGVDVEPGAAERRDYGLKCRLYRTPDGLTGEPAEGWLLDAIVLRSARWAADRLAGLGAPERRLYRAILTGFAEGRTPAAHELRELDPQGHASETLVERDLIQLAKDGSVAVAYPFSAEPTHQSVRLADGRRLWAMCAVDALGIAFLVHAPAEVEAEEPDGGPRIRVGVDPAGGEARWRPRDAVVAVAAAGAGCSATCACPHINLFASTEAAERYLGRPGIDGAILSVPEATEAGRRLFGDLLERLSEPGPVEYDPSVPG